MVIRRTRLFCALAILIIFFSGFAAGFFACVNAKVLPKTMPRQSAMQPSGDAAPSVRAGVLRSLKIFEAGYTAPDSGDIDLKDLFDEKSEVLIVGTDEPNWVRGYSAAVQFVRADWTQWGDLRLNLNDPFISSWQDVAWVMTEGEVRFPENTKPLIFSAVLVREGDKWRFRNMEFQWDERRRSSLELFQPELYFNTVNVALQKLVSGTFRADRAR